MRHLIKKLNCDNYETLVAASSIIRPGVGRSGMMDEYVYRHHHPDKIKYSHPGLEPILKTTNGIMIYQEQVIQVAHEWAGLDMADADLLRRATSFKYRSKIDINSLRNKFFSNCESFGYPIHAVTEVWDQIASFADFSFCKAHSASFAVESYQSLYLKTYHPMEFMVSVIKNFGGFYSRELYFYELMKTGARVHPPCVNKSDYQTSIHGIDAYVGFVHIKSLEQALVEKIIMNRGEFGDYLDLQDFIERTAIGLEQLNILIRIGAFRFTKKSKKELLWEANFLQKKNKNHLTAQRRLFFEPPKKYALPILTVYPLDDVYDEVEILGFPARDPFLLVDDDPKNYVLASDLENHVGQIITVLAYHITHKPVRTIKGQTMSFGTFIDSAMNWIDTVHFPDMHQKASPRAGFFRITGKLTEQWTVYSLEVTDIEKAPIKSRIAHYM